MRRLFKFKYVKIVVLFAAIILAFLIFSNPSVKNFISNLGTFGYVGIFFAGIFFGIGFTAPFAAGFFITLNPSNIFLAAIIGGFGTLVENLILFHFLKFSFKKEFIQLKKSGPVKKASDLIAKSLGKKIKSYLLYVFTGMVIALPLPDEIGISMLAGFTHINSYLLGKISFILHTIGILFLLYI